MKNTCASRFALLVMATTLLVAGSILKPLSLQGAGRELGVDVSHWQGESGISQTSWN